MLLRAGEVVQNLDVLCSGTQLEQGAVEVIGACVLGIKMGIEVGP